MTEPLGYGLIGCGGFGLFCLEQYQAMPDLRCVAVADVDAERRGAAAARFGLPACASPEALLARHDVDLVHIATPPGTHRALVMAALEADKHVLCEKPLAIDPDDARAMVARSQAKRRVLAVNLIMRYAPFCEIVKAVVEQGLLGQALHAHFLNDAKDEPLPPEHWFWDRRQSGGIFVEHGVHFFDVFDWWFGPGRVVSALQMPRPGSGTIEAVQAVVRYGDAVLADFYHGFHQAARMEGQEWRLGFEMGRITMQEWVPTRIRIDFLGTDAIAETLASALPGAPLTRVERYRGAARHLTSRGQRREVDGRFALDSGPPVAKPELYGAMVRALLSDQLAAIRDPRHERRVSEANGLASVLTAVAAQRLADRAV